jgi:acetyl esterase/lipase
MTSSIPTLLVDGTRRGHGHAYGPHHDQRADLRVPKGRGPFPVAVVIHGGYWQPTFGKLVMRFVCGDLVRRGWATWNVEYRRLGPKSGGGWPMTFDDVAAAIDRLADLDPRLDLDRVVLVGHSAGGHLALWAAGRTTIPAGMPGADPQVRPVAVAALAAVADLERGGTLVRPGGVATQLVGGTPAEVPERYDVANPLRMVPLPVPALLVHGPQDGTVPVGQSRDYARANDAAGGSTELVEPAAGHRSFVDPRSAGWKATAERLDGLLQRGLDAAAETPSVA